MGYFRDLGVETSMEPGPSDGTAVVKFVAIEQADIGFASPGVLSFAVNNGMDWCRSTAFARCAAAARSRARSSSCAAISRPLRCPLGPTPTAAAIQLAPVPRPISSTASPRRKVAQGGAMQHPLQHLRQKCIHQCLVHNSPSACSRRPIICLCNVCA